MPLPSPRSILAIAVMPLLAPSSPAQPASVNYPYHTKYTLAWESSLTYGATPAYSRVVAGTLTNDLTRDVVVLSAGYPVLLNAPATLQALHSLSLGGYLGGPVDDIAVLPGWSGNQDALLSVGALGLHLHVLDQATATFLPPLSVAPGNPWTGVKRMRVISAGGVGYVFGVAADQVTVHTKTFVPASGFTDLPSFTAPSPVRDLVPLHWDAVGGPELALLCDSGVRVHALASGTALLALPAWHPSGVLAAMHREDDPARDRLAWITKSPNQQNHLLYLVEPLGIEGPVVLNMAAIPPVPLDPVGLSAGDVDQDGDDDLLLGVCQRASDYLLLNRAELGSPRFSVTSNNCVALVTTPAGQVPAASDRTPGLLIDLDRDDGLDYVRPISTTARVLARPLLPIPGQPTGGATYQVGPDGVFAATSVAFGNQLDFTVDLVMPTQSFTPTHVQVVLWRQPDPIATTTDVEGARVSNTLYTLAAGGSHQRVTVAMPEFSPDIDARHYYLEFRFVIAAPNGNGQLTISSSSRTYLAVMANDYDHHETYLSYVETLSGYDATQNLLAQTGGNTITFVFTPIIRTGHFSEADPPRPNPIDQPVKTASSW